LYTIYYQFWMKNSLQSVLFALLSWMVMYSNLMRTVDMRNMKVLVISIYIFFKYGFFLYIIILPRNFHRITCEWIRQYGYATFLPKCLSCTNTSCKDDIVLNRWERLLRATEWPVTTVTVTQIKWNDRNESKSIYTTLSPTQTTQVATKGMKYSFCTKK
jgi:hypothetical protein